MRADLADFPWAELDRLLGPWSVPLPARDPDWTRVAVTTTALHGALAAVVHAAGAREQVHAVRIEGTRCTSARALLDTWGNALEFPAYYGRNLDAFNECMTDLLVLERGGLGAEFGDRPGRPVRALVVSVGNAQDVLRDESPEQLVTFLNRLESAASDTGERRAALRVLFECDAGSAATAFGEQLRRL